MATFLSIIEAVKSDRLEKYLAPSSLNVTWGTYIPG